MHCDAWDEGRCRSCSLIQQPYAAQLAGKLAQARALLDPLGPIDWLEPAASRESGFRNKAKMVVGGSVEHPSLGILDGNGLGVDLTDCPLYPEPIRACFPALAEFISRARLVPYDVPGRHGELKYLLLTLAEHSGELMLRFVLRSTESLPRIRKHLPHLQATLPGLRVVSANLQPEHKAIFEGEQEILLSRDEALPMQVNDMTLYLRPRSFFQTNSAVAAMLYRQARDWIAEIDPPALWDLYCGVGGFALHCSDGIRTVIGIELSAEAIASARRSAAAPGLANLHFEVADATAWVEAATALPPLLIVNPPRRGLGSRLCRRLRHSEVRHIVYSSCNAVSLARDIAELDDFRPTRARLFDMFPQTAHGELCCLLERTPTA